MYVPPYEALLKSVGTNKAEVERTKNIQIPTALLKLLLQMALAQADFDEQSYLEANPDVRQAVRRGAIESGFLHFIGFGYFEGRTGGMARVDEQWYLKKYPDVADAISAGKVQSAAHHFTSGGAGEGRSPSASEEDNALQWKKALAQD